MSRFLIGYEVADISALARSLRDQLNKLDQLPGHVALLNMLARSAGFRNFQHYRADAGARERLIAAAKPPPAPDHDRCEKVARHFDNEGRMLRWPGKTNHQELCIWVLWSRLPHGAAFTERQISELLESWHLFGDHAILRRSLVEMGLVSRTADGRQYVRIERSPPVELGVLLARLQLPAA